MMYRTYGLGIATTLVLLAGATPARATPIWTISASTLSPNSIAPGPHGKMWVSSGVMSTSSSSPRYAIARFDLAGRRKLFHTTAETDGIAVAGGGTVYATERLAGRVAIVSPAGRVTEVAVPGGDDARPVQVAAGADGNGWFVQDGTSQVGRITPTGQITEFDLPPVPEFDAPGDTTDANPHGIAAGGDGRLWVPVDNGIAIVSTDGRIEEHSWAFSFPTSASDVVAAPDGGVWTSELEHPQLERVDAGGNATAVPGVEAASLAVARGGALSEFDPGDDTRVRIVPGKGTSTQRLTTKEAPGSRVSIRVTGLQAAAAGPAGTVWAVATVQFPHSGSSDALAVLDDGGRCIVPSLHGQGLATAKLALRNHGCRLGRVRSHNPRHFKRSLLEVSRQGVKAGTVHRGRTKVSISLE